MADEARLGGINWREAFPFTHLFRAFRISVHPSKLVLGLIALVSLYVGGRVLDGIWPARHLAVPGEVYDYERASSDSSSGTEFANSRRRAREAVEDSYAQRLLELGIVKDRSAAQTAATEGKYLSEVKEALLTRRMARVTDAETARRDSRAIADRSTDSHMKDRLIENANDTCNQAVRAAYDDAYQDYRAARAIGGAGLFRAFFSYQAERIVGVVRGIIGGNWLGTWREDRGPGVVENVINFFTVGPVWLMRHHPAYFVIFTLWFLTVWSIFGGAIARIAAVHVARDEKLSVRAALAFSLGKFLSFLSAPLIPLVIVLVVGLLPLVAGLLASIPILGPIFNLALGALFILALAAGFVMTLVLLGTFGGFNLMYPTIAVEGSDSFDAISRSFSYVYARPWRMVFYTVVALVYGALTYMFVRTFIWLMLTLTHHFVGAGMFATAPNTEPLWPAMWRGPTAPPGRLSYEIDWLTLNWHQGVSAGLVAFWVYLVVGMLGAYAISFYFTANTIIYFLMRNEVDATEMDDVYMEQSDDDFTDAAAPAEPGTPSEPPPAAESPPPGS